MAKKHDKRHRNGRPAPKGRLDADFAVLKASNCLMADNPELFVALMAATNSNPCDGCWQWDKLGTDCRAYKRHHTAAKDAVTAREKRILDATTAGTRNSADAFAGLTVRQIANKLNTSISEVRRRKVAGTLG